MGTIRREAVPFEDIKGKIAFTNDPPPPFLKTASYCVAQASVELGGTNNLLTLPS